MKKVIISFRNELWYAHLVNESDISEDSVTSDNFPGLLVEIGNKDWVYTLKHPTETIKKIPNGN